MERMLSEPKPPEVRSFLAILRMRVFSAESLGRLKGSPLVMKAHKKKMTAAAPATDATPCNGEITLTIGGITMTTGKRMRARRGVCHQCRHMNCVEPPGWRSRSKKMVTAMQTRMMNMKLVFRTWSRRSTMGVWRIAGRTTVLSPRFSLSGKGFINISKGTQSAFVSLLRRSW